MARILLPATLLLLALLSSPPTVSATSGKLILDINGNPLHTGLTYHVVTHVRLDGGGVSMVNIGPPICPSGFQVVQSGGFNDFGIPVSFNAEANSHLGPAVNITTSLKINIEFAFLVPSPLCRRLYPRSWSLSSPNNDTGNVYLKLGFVESPSFNIEKRDDGCGGYTIKYSPSDDKLGDVMSGYVSVLGNGNYGERLLGLDTSNNPLVVAFVPTIMPF